MIAKYVRRSLILGMSGILLQVAGVLKVHSETPIEVGETRVMWGSSLVTLGVLLWTAGLASFAMAKGRASWWGLIGLLGLPGLYQPYLTLLSLVGLVVLALLPDRSGRTVESGLPGTETL